MNVNDYVRTKNKTFMPSQIAKIVSMEKDEGYKNQYFIKLDHNLLHDFEYFVYEEDVLKTSPNIIDLIEVGDYVNGFRVQDVIGCLLVFDGGQDGEWYIETEEDIKSIVTREQFESMQYNLESEVN